MTAIETRALLRYWRPSGIALSTSAKLLSRGLEGSSARGYLLSSWALIRLPEMAYSRGNRSTNVTAARTR